MRASDFDYELPTELIAQAPAPERDRSRMMVLDRRTGAVTHQHFPALLEHLRPGDVLVLNNSRVIPARLHGTKPVSGGQIEVLLLEENSLNDWWVMVRPGKRVRRGSQIALLNREAHPTEVSIVVLEKNAEGHCRVTFSGVPNIVEALETLGEVPLPPYINRDETSNLAIDDERYQTVYAQPPGSVAAPTAGLHFTAELLNEVQAQGVKIAFVTLHIGLGTFAPVKAEELAAHMMHEERFELCGEAADVINTARLKGGRVIAVGTTTVRVLESVAAANGGRLVATTGKTRIFIHPPFRFQIVDALLTNFHLPRSTLLMLVSAFAAPGETRGRDLALAAYAQAVRERYRFFSYGDAMLLL
jgi:S-adenosylmethionine:tRNA ribosyltransferase-isomerase